MGEATQELGWGLWAQPLAWDFPHRLKFMGLWNSTESWLGAQIPESQFWGVPVPCCAIDRVSCLSHLTSLSLNFII